MNKRILNTHCIAVGDKLLRKKSSALMKLSLDFFQKCARKIKRLESSFTILPIFHDASKSATTRYTALWSIRATPCLLPFDTTLSMKSNESFVQDLKNQWKNIFILSMLNIRESSNYAAAYYRKN